MLEREVWLLERATVGIETDRGAKKLEEESPSNERLRIDIS